MTEIKIKRLSLENFKCHERLTLDFMGGNASIYGDNASGKTSIYDALTWLLFGKDSAGNGEKNIEIKPLNSLGEVKDHLAVTAVEAVLLVNGEEITLRRTLKEVWTTKRGATTETYDGNTSDYYIDGVPCKKNAFTARVDELVGEETFRLLTSVSHFANAISWQERRKVLFDVAGVMDDAQILASCEQFAPLLAGMGRLTVEDYKKKLLAEKKGFVGAKTEIPARISECQKTIADFEGLDFDTVRIDLSALQARADGISTRILAIDHDQATEKKRMEIGDVQSRERELERENDLYRRSQTANAPDVGKMKRELHQLELRLDSRQREYNANHSKLASHDHFIKASRDRWIAVNGESFLAGNCPTCGQTLPTAKLTAAREAFEATKVKRLAEIEQTAAAQKDAKAQTEARLAELAAEIAELQEQIAEACKMIELEEASKVEPVDMADYAERKEALRLQFITLSDELRELQESSASVKRGLMDELSVIKAEISDKAALLGKESLMTYAKHRVEELREDARNAAERLDAIERMLYLMDEYSRYKTRFVEDSINSLFRIARFRLFREQANGGIEDRCDVVLDGVPYMGINNGAKINAGIDIINTLSRAYGVSVPLFIDNAESVTRLEGSASQIIRLVVSENDKELRISYEN